MRFIVKSLNPYYQIMLILVVLVTFSFESQPVRATELTDTLKFEESGIERINDDFVSPLTNQTLRPLQQTSANNA